MCDYIGHRVAQAGAPGENLFPLDAMQVIFEYSQGIPRLVNSVCDSALQNGFALHSPKLTSEIVEEAAKDLDMIKAASAEKNAALQVPFIDSRAQTGWTSCPVERAKCTSKVCF